MFSTGLASLLSFAIIEILLIAMVRVIYCDDLCDLLCDLLWIYYVIYYGSTMDLLCDLLWI